MLSREGHGHGQAPEADQSTGRVKAGYIIQMCRNKCKPEYWSARDMPRGE